METRIARAEAMAGPLAAGSGRGARRHVVILDGTLSSLDAGRSTNAGRIYKLLRDLPPVLRPSIFYEEGQQWQRWGQARDVITGRGINRKIRRAYAFLAARYRPGDRIYLFGYSRGAFAVRSLAGLIDRVGLMRKRHATDRMIEAAYRHYRCDPHGAKARVFARKFCHPDVPIEVVGVFDTVKALGWRLPGLAGLTESAHDFHSHHLGRHIRHGFHALALDETRVAYTPVLWESPEGHTGRVEQLWFRGNHGDVGGQLSGFAPARPLANVPLVWMLERAGACGLPLPDGWQDRFPCDSAAPSTGALRGWGKFFALRARREVGLDPSEALHPTACGTAPRRHPVCAARDAAEGGAGPLWPTSWGVVTRWPLPPWRRD